VASMDKNLDGSWEEFEQWIRDTIGGRTSAGESVHVTAQPTVRWWPVSF